MNWHPNCGMPVLFCTSLGSISRSKPTAFRRCAFRCVLDTVRMVEYRKSSHAIWDVKYHVVWITKYRYKVLRGDIAVVRGIFCGRYANAAKLW
jgi:hypothetical protein